MSKVRWVMLCGLYRNFIRFPAVQKLEIGYDLTKLQRVYRLGSFFETQCIL